MADDPKKELHLDGIDQVLIIDSLKWYSEFSKNKAREYKERGRQHIAAARAEIAEETERLAAIFTNANKVVVS